MQKNTPCDFEAIGAKIWCQFCKKAKPFSAFSQRGAKIAEAGDICLGCERHWRVTVQRETWQEQQQERAERRQQTWQRRIALRQAHEERDREREHWYQQQSDRCCRTCRQIFPASAFGSYSSGNGVTLYTRCKTCHDAMVEHRQLSCCLCQRRTSRRNFLSRWDGYEICGDGVAISLCCRACEINFRELSVDQQALSIRSCCQRAFPVGQVIYAEVDPETREIRYIGRTGRPERRHAQHLGDRSTRTGLWGSERSAWYTRRNWMQALAEKALTPSMEILQSVEIAPLVMEWEQRFIFHGIQRGWKLLNWQIMDQELVAHVRASSLDFFLTPFDVLVQQHFFPSHGLIAFLHKWYQPEHPSTGL